MELNQDLVEEGKALVVKTEQAERMTSENRLALGRWALRVYPMQDHGTNRFSVDRSADPSTIFDAYAEAIGIKRVTLEDYRKIANAWGDAPADGLAWSVIRKLCWREDREEFSAAVFAAYGKVTEYTIEMYMARLRDENKRREQLLEQVPETDNYEEEWDEEEEEVEYIYDPVTSPVASVTQPRKHGFSGPIRKLFAVVEHVRAAKALIVEESIPSVDYANDEHFEEILAACDTIVTEIIDYREMVVAKRVKAGLSPEVG